MKKKAKKLKLKLKKAGHSKRLVKDVLKVYNKLRGLRKAAEKKEDKLAKQNLKAACSDLSGVVKACWSLEHMKDYTEVHGEKVF